MFGGTPSLEQERRKGGDRWGLHDNETDGLLLGAAVPRL